MSLRAKNRTMSLNVTSCHLMPLNQFHVIDVIVQFIDLICFHQIYVLISASPSLGWGSTDRFGYAERRSPKQKRDDLGWWKAMVEDGEVLQQKCSKMLKKNDGNAGKS